VASSGIDSDMISGTDHGDTPRKPRFRLDFDPKKQKENKRKSNIEKGIGIAFQTDFLQLDADDNLELELAATWELGQAFES